jgi:hypothetical protein
MCLFHLQYTLRIPYAYLGESPALAENKMLASSLTIICICVCRSPMSIGLSAWRAVGKFDPWSEFVSRWLTTCSCSVGFPIVSQNISQLFWQPHHSVQKLSSTTSWRLAHRLQWQVFDFLCSDRQLRHVWFVENCSMYSITDFFHVWTTQNVFINVITTL